MHRLALELALLRQRTPDGFTNFHRNIPAELILQALAETDTASVRRRRLPAEQVVWLIIGMALMRDLTIVQVVDRLQLALPGKQPVAASTVAEARARLGKAPLEWLFVTTADTWAHRSARQHAWRGLAIYGVDGSSLRVADSDESDAHRGQYVKNFLALDFQLTRQIVNSNLTHPLSFPLCPANLVVLSSHI